MLVYTTVTFGTESDLRLNLGIPVIPKRLLQNENVSSGITYGKK